ncbi:MAG: mechanosensitive ion channel [Pedobacter sp.]|nr:mechanosensitive ion channel [Pedobacter sp.]MDQ8052670.1 mechanosensitive ion channel [Pedobacter sp.]
MQYLQKLQAYLPTYLYHLILAVGAVVLGLLIAFILRRSFQFFSRFWATFQINSIIRHLNKPVGVFIPFLLLNVAVGMMDLDKPIMIRVEKLLEILLTINFGLILIGSVKVLEDILVHRFDVNKEDNLKERKVRTQIQFIRKFIVATLVMLTIAAVLLSFESMRKIGTGLLTGVGIGGIIIGFAAQKSLGNLLAGFQIAFTQPIRIDDVVVVENEWGKVEEITLTYVVVNLWDQRRLVLPITYFIEKPFQNWTRVSAELLGTVFLYLDYTIPIDVIRAEFARLLQQSPLWDKRTNVVHLTDTKENYIEVRMLMSAKNAGNTFELRAYIREKMVAFVVQHYPDALVKTRVSHFDKVPAPTASN